MLQMFFMGACGWHAHVGMSNWDVACKLSAHFTTISHLQCRFGECGSTSDQRHNRRHHVGAGPLHPASPAISSETVHPQTVAKVGLGDQKTLHCVLGIYIRVLPWLQTVVVNSLTGQMFPFSVWRFGGMCYSLHGRIQVFTVPGRWQVAFAVPCERVVCSLWKCWWRGHVVARHKLQTMNTDVSYWCQFECTEILGRDSQAHCGDAHHYPPSHCSTIMHCFNTPYSFTSTCREPEQKQELLHFFVECASVSKVTLQQKMVTWHLSQSTVDCCKQVWIWLFAWMIIRSNIKEIHIENVCLMHSAK